VLTLSKYINYLLLYSEIHGSKQCDVREEAPLRIKVNESYNRECSVGLLPIMS